MSLVERNPALKEIVAASFYKADAAIRAGHTNILRTEILFLIAIAITLTSDEKSTAFLLDTKRRLPELNFSTLTIVYPVLEKSMRS